MLALQEELSSTENKIAFARQAFNDAATDYNIRREVFPANTVAGMFGFKEAAWNGIQALCAQQADVTTRIAIANVAHGSKGDIGLPSAYARLTPKNGHRRAPSRSPIRTGRGFGSGRWSDWLSGRQRMPPSRDHELNVGVA